MKRIGILKRDKLISILNWFIIFLAVIYFIFMIGAPWIEGNWEWEYVQRVWNHWQSLNVGILAFLSSIVAFNISRFNANKKREREFIAARAFLPDALSELSTYFKSSANLLAESWERVRDSVNRFPKAPLQSKMPNLPANYKETFSRCIALADPDVGDYLAYILMRLQIHHTRLVDLEKIFREGSREIVISMNIISCLYSLAELQALTNRIFGYARGLDKFDDRVLVWDDFQNAYSNLNIRTEEFEDLVGFTERTIDRKSSDNNT